MIGIIPSASRRKLFNIDQQVCSPIMLMARSVLGLHGHLNARSPPSSVAFILSTFAGSGFFLSVADLTS